MKPLVPITILSLVLGSYVFTAAIDPLLIPVNFENEVHKPDVSVSGVEVSGKAGEYIFHVGLKSDDTGCEQYADWWEVVDGNGTLLYRRILAHSHVEEQPFTRSGGPVVIREDQVVIIRGHMNEAGYGSNIFRGSVKQGFTESAADAKFALNLESSPPLPEGCAF